MADAPIKVCTHAITQRGHTGARIGGQACYPEPTLFPQISQSGDMLTTVWLHPEGGFVPATKRVAVRRREAGIATIEQ